MYNVRTVPSIINSGQDAPSTFNNSVGYIVCTMSGLILELATVVKIVPTIIILE